jgi:hypothetical protein
VADHSGSMSGMANLHFTYTNASAGQMKVGKTVQVMDDAVCFFDSVRHSVVHTGNLTRWTLVARVPHPNVFALDLYQPHPLEQRTVGAVPKSEF